MFCRIALKTLSSVSCGCLKTCLGVSLIDLELYLQYCLTCILGISATVWLECDPAFPIVVPGVQMAPVSVQHFVQARIFIFVLGLYFSLNHPFSSTSFFFVLF